MRDAYKKCTITTITSPNAKRTITGSVMTMVIRGIKEKRTLKKVLTPRNLKQRRRVLGL
jgi:hypothetical protein